MSWAKIHESMFEGSMFGKNALVQAVWIYCIVKASRRDALVELNPEKLASQFDSTKDAVREAIDFLCSPDPDSRTKTEEGRRLIRLDEYTYKVVNLDRYQSMRQDAEHEREMVAKRVFAFRQRVAGEQVSEDRNGKPLRKTENRYALNVLNRDISSNTDNKTVTENRYVIADKVIGWWNKHAPALGFPAVGNRDAESLSKLRCKILSRLKQHPSATEWKEMLAVAEKDKDYLSQTNWFELDFVVRSDDTWRHVASQWHKSQAMQWRRENGKKHPPGWVDNARQIELLKRDAAKTRESLKRDAEKTKGERL